MPARQIAWTLRRSTCTVWILAFVVAIAQPIGGFSIAAASSPDRLSDPGASTTWGSLSKPGSSQYAALPTWFDAVDIAVNPTVNAADASVRPLPGWFSNVSAPRPLFQAIPSLSKTASTITPTLRQVYTYTLVFTIPSGLTIFDAKLSDELPDVLPRIEPEPGSATDPVDSSGTPLGAVISYGAYSLTWDLGNITGPSVYTTTYRAQVDDNEDYVARGNIGTNEAALSWVGDSISTSVDVTVVAPAVQVKRIAYTDSGERAESSTPDDALKSLRTGEVITVTVLITNNVVEAVSPAYRVRVRDHLPTWIDYLEMIDGPEPVVGSGGILQPGTRLEWQAANRGGTIDALDVLTAGERFSVTYRARVVAGVAPGHNDLRYTEAEYYTLLEGGARERPRPTITFATPSIDIVKRMEKRPTTLPDQAAVVAGEIVTYTIVYTLPWGTQVYSPTFLLDRLDDGLRFLNVAQQPPGLAPPSVDESREAETVLRWDIREPLSRTEDVTHTYVIAAQVSPTYFLGTNAGQAVPQGTQLDNEAALNWRLETDDLAISIDSVAVWLVRPEIQPIKWKEDPLNEFEGAGLPVRFELRAIQNISSEFGAVAYNIVVTDILPQGWELEGADPPANPPTTVNGQTVITWGPVISLPVDYYLPSYSPTPSRFVVTATPPVTVVAGALFTNTAEVSYNSAEGYRYVDRSALWMTLPPDLRKDVIPVSPYQVGEVITYTLVGVVPANAVFYWPRHVDTLPEGVRYTGWYSTTGGTLFAGPAVGTNIDGQEVITWWWETLDNSANENPFTFTFSLETVLTGINTKGDLEWSSYRSSLRMDNQSILMWNTEDISGTYAAQKSANRRDRVIQPHLVNPPPIKEVASGGPTVVGGDLLAYGLAIFNTGRAPAYEVLISDTLPPGLVYRSYQARVYPATGRPPYDPIALAAPSDGAEGTIAWVFEEVAEGDGNTFDPTTQLLVTYTVEVQESIGAGAALTNSALVSDYSSLRGDQPFERHYAYLGGAGAQAGPVSMRDADIAKSANVTEVVLGEHVIFTITVPGTPLGATMYNVTVTDKLPPAPPGPFHVLNAVAPGATSLNFTSDTVSADFGTLAPYAQETIVIDARVPFTAIGGLVQNDATVAWDDANAGGVRHYVTSDPADVTIATPDVRVTKDAPGAASPGFTVRYTLVYENKGLATASQVRLTDTMPSGVTYVEMSYDRLVTPTGSVPGPLVWDLGELSSGEGGTIWVTATIWSTATLGSRLVNTATINTPTLGDDLANNQDTAVIVVSGAVLDVVKTGTPDPVPAGGRLLYTLVVTNSGAQTAENVVITDQVPLDTNFVGASPGGLLVGNAVHWNPGDLAVDGHTAVTFAVQVASALLSGTLIANDMYGAMADNAPFLLNDPVIVTVHSLPVLTIDKMGPAATSPDADLVYTIRYRNIGTAAAHNVRVVESYDPNVTFISAVPPPDVGDDEWQIDLVAPGGEGTLVVTVHVDPAVENGTIIVNRAVIDSDETDPVADTVSTQVGVSTVLFIPILMKDYQPPPPIPGVNLMVQSIQVGPATPAVGQSTRITLTLYNSGPNPVTKDFWVDMYVDPSAPPSINVLWNDIAPYGKAWFIHDDIPGGSTLIIHTDQPDDPHDPGAIYSNWPGWFVSAGDHVLYAQVDSYGLDWGLILEDDETDNVTGPQTVTVVPGTELMVPSSPIQWQERR